MRTMRRALLLFWTGLLLACCARADFQMFPSSNLYPHYVADPRRPEFGLTILGFPDPQIPDSGDPPARELNKGLQDSKHRIPLAGR